MVKYAPWLLILLTGCAVEHGHAGVYLICDRQVHMDMLNEMDHAKCDKRLPLQFNFNF
jgi:hypothetical protein